MSPVAFLVILCLGLASAAAFPDARLDAELQEQTIKVEKSKSLDEEGHRRGVWAEFTSTMESGQEEDESGLDENDFSNLSEEKLKAIINILPPIFGEDKIQPYPPGDYSEIQELVMRGDMASAQDQPE